MKKRHLFTKNWRRRGKGEKLILSVMLVIFIVYAASLLYPLIWAAYNSLKTGREFNENQFVLPTILQWKNYISAFSVKVGNTSLLMSLFNSCWMTALNVICGLTFSAMTAYVVAKYKFRGSSIIYAVAIFIQIIPLVGNMPATYKLMHSTLGIANNPMLYWVTWCGGFGFSFLMLYGAFKNVSWTYAEAAMMDGANRFQVFYKVMIPMIKPVLVSLAIVNSIGAWNDYMTPYLYMNDYPTLSLAVYELSEDAVRVGIPLYFAIIIISIIPTMTIFIIFQKTIMENVTTGGLKG